jgi:molecular chaperone DnaK (HSP70)
MVKERVEARNKLESYVYSLRNQIDDKEKLGDKLSENDKATIEKAVTEKIEWLGANNEASTDELHTQKKELETIVQPLVGKLYAGAGTGGEDDGKDEL